MTTHHPVNAPPQPTLAEDGESRHKVTTPAMSEAPPKAMMRRLPCHVLPLIFVAWFTFCYLVGGDGIFFALMASYPTILVEKLPFVEALSPTYLPIWRQWTDVFVCGYIQWLLVNYLLLKGYCLMKRRSALR